MSSSPWLETNNLKLEPQPNKIVFVWGTVCGWLLRRDEINNFYLWTFNYLIVIFCRKAGARYTSHLTLSSSLLDRSEVEGGVDPTGDQDGEDDHLLEVLWDHSHRNTSKRHGDGIQEPDRHVVAEGDHVPHSPVRSDDRDVPDNLSLPPSSHLLLSQTERLLVVPELVDLDIAVRDEWDEGVTEKSHPQSRISLWII